MVFKLLPFLLIPHFLTAACGYHLPWGKDAPLLPKQALEEPPPRYDPSSRVAENLILFHQNYLSPLSKGRSNFRPTSSRYMLLSIRRFGFLSGYLRGCDRLMRENKDPWVYRTRLINNKLYKWDPTQPLYTQKT